ncbi:MAG: ABC transporter ATP-binding protein [Lachnospiraceae bacterium]
MKKIRKYLWKHKWAYLVAMLSMIIAVSLDMLAPLVTRKVVDDVIIGGKMEVLKYCLLAFLGIGIGRCIFQYSKEYLFDITGSKVAVEIRRDVFTHVQGLSADFFDRTGTGELMARVKDDVDRIWDAASYVSMLLIEVALHTGIVLFCMYRLNWRLAIIPTVAMIVCACIALVMERKLGSIYEEISEENAALNTVAEENLAGVRTVKAFAREKYEISKFLKHNNRYYELNMKQSKVFVRYYPYFGVITKILPLLTVLIGGYEVIYQGLSLGTLSAFVEYSNNIVWPMEMLGWLTNSISSAAASSKKLQKLCKEQPTVTEPEQPRVLEHISGKISFEDVSFHKADGHEILKHISFEAKPGQTVGIMGETGSGKSSLIYLLQRMYDVTGGCVKIDDVDVKEMSLQQLRSSISLVQQDVFLFSDTISENEKLGKHETVDYETIKKASRDAQACEFIERMEEQYETVIGERGVGLSGGQKQRISIARALAKQAPILILDDATSALDTETERAIEQTLEQMAQMTRLIITHRISAVRNADLILVLEDGEIKERGTHAQLMEQQGLYYRTYQIQYGETLGEGV